MVVLSCMRRKFGLAGNWLRHVQNVHQEHKRYFGDVLPIQWQVDRLFELNAIERVANVCQTKIVQKAW